MRYFLSDSTQGRTCNPQIGSDLLEWNVANYLRFFLHQF